MDERKRIALITANPESLYQQRVMEGVFSQCNKYNYDVVVFSTLVHINHFDKDYLAGELGIYDWIDYNSFDGIITTPITLSDNNTSKVYDNLLVSMAKDCHCKVVALDMEFGDYEVCYTDDRSTFYEITRHVCEVHKCQKIYFLAGYKGHSSSVERLAGYMDYMQEHGRKVEENEIFYGDFWYSSGEKLADDIASGAVPMPEAVICASDHMAIGLANQLIEHGIRIPEQVIITGYDATQEAVSNDISITSFIPPVARCAAQAVDIIHHCIAPEEPVYPIEFSKEGTICIGESCGCTTDVTYMKQKLNAFLYGQMHNYRLVDTKNEYDISLLMESYMYENMIRPTTPKEYYEKVHQFSYLINPYNDFYLVLFEDWMEEKKERTRDSDNMILAVHTSSKLDKKNQVREIPYDKKPVPFDRLDSFSRLQEDREKPSVFYVSTVHFVDEILGYSVLSCDLTQKRKINYIYRHWLRNVTNALEMLRIKMHISSLSLFDSATGLYNRRGMYRQLETIAANAEDHDLLIIMADMDGLKYINDHYGHQEGDFGLLSIANTLTSIVDNDNEFCVRNGGDEFLFVGVGSYTKEIIDAKLNRVEQAMVRLNTKVDKPYEISASFGYCCDELSADTNIDILIGIADGRMYEQKKKKHKARK